MKYTKIPRKLKKKFKSDICGPGKWKGSECHIIRADIGALYNGRPRLHYTLKTSGRTHKKHKIFRLTKFAA